jgi:hypothetical protein
MRTIEGVAKITNEGKLILDVPPDIVAGEQRVVVTLVDDVKTTQSEPVETAEVAPLPPYRIYGKFLPPAPNRPPIPGARRRSREEIWASLSKIFTPEEMQDTESVDWDEINFGSKTGTEIISELREERL